MWSSLLLGLMLSVQNGTVAGTIVPPEGMAVSRPIQVVLLPSEYMNLWNSETQRRLDDYWERYKPTFAVNKEYYIEVSVAAYRDALRYVFSRMQGDPKIEASLFAHSSSADGSFEFRNVPFGEYVVVASGMIGSKEYIWHESLDMKSAVPLFVPLKTRIP